MDKLREKIINIQIFSTFQLDWLPLTIHLLSILEHNITNKKIQKRENSENDKTIHKVPHKIKIKLKN